MEAKVTFYLKVRLGGGVTFNLPIQQTLSLHATVVGAVLLAA